MIDICIVGEDDATREIIKRIIVEYGQGKLNIVHEMPARGGQIKGKISLYNNLASRMPVIILLDLDASNCPPELLRVLNIENKLDSLIINIAVDEAESWLMADRKGFAKYFAVDEDSIPQSSLTKLNGNKYVREMDFPAKSSWCLTHQIIPNSKRNDIKQQMIPQDNACKGKEYNAAVVPYIKNNWDIDEAMRNSDSLRRMVDKIKGLAC